MRAVEHGWRFEGLPPWSPGLEGPADSLRFTWCQPFLSPKRQNVANLIIWAGLLGAAVLLLTWVLYPATVWALSLFFPSPEPGSGHQPHVSVILATREPDDIVRKRVEDVLRTSYPLSRLEVRVSIDASSGPASPELRDFQSGALVTVVRGNEPGGKSATLNAGVEGAKGEILLFIDSEQQFDPHTIPALVGAFSDPEVAAASGSLSLRDEGGGTSPVLLYWKMERWLRGREARIHSSVGVTGAVWAMRASQWKTLPPGLILDDLYTPMRLALDGHRIAFVEEALARDTREHTPHQEHLRKVRTLTGVIQLCAWLPSVLRPWQNPIFLQFLLHKVFRLFTPMAGLLVVLGAGWFFASLPAPMMIPAVIGLTGITVWVLSGWPPPALRFRRILLEALLMQFSVLKAVWNGFRGRWDVW